LETFLHDWLSLHLKDRWLTQLFMSPELGPRRVDESRDRIAPFLDAIADRSREQGSARADFYGTDVFFIQLSLMPLIDRTRSLAPDLYRRHLAMFLDGAAAAPDTSQPLPVPALSVETLTPS